MAGEIGFLGIDFGTTNSTFAGWDPDGAAARVLRDAEGQDKTPSIVYFGEVETLVGVLAENMLADGRGKPEVAGRIVRSVKRNLLSPPLIGLPDGRSVRPVEVSAEILAKLKHDAEQANGKHEIARAVITCPAMFGGPERTVLTEAAVEAGFKELELLEEPRAAALAFARGDDDIGNGVLVYDFGGGTFDAAFVAREAPGEVFELAMDPEGDLRCGGDDLDQKLYDYGEAEARRELGRGITLEEGVIDLEFLRQCRRRKENLSKSPQETFSTLLDGGLQFRTHIDRATFEDLIREDVDRTVRITEHMAQRARDDGYDVDMILLVGGSSQIPLVRQRLREVLDVPLKSWRLRDVAVAMGAAEYADVLWKARRPPSTEERYRRAVELVWRDEVLEEAELARVAQFADELGLGADVRAEIEHGVMGARKERVFYRAAVETAWAGKAITRAEGNALDALVRKLKLRGQERVGIEREVIGKTLAELLKPAPAPPKPQAETPKPKPAGAATAAKPATPYKPATTSGGDDSLPWWMWVIGIVIFFVIFGDDLSGCVDTGVPTQ
jgi:actin-like ATPase involved in cell morphogenesis